MKGAQKAEDTRTGVDRPGSAGALLNGGMGRIFLKPSHSVTFRKPDACTMHAIPLPFVAKSAKEVLKGAALSEQFGTSDGGAGSLFFAFQPSRSPGSPPCKQSLIFISYSHHGSDT
jgi:hypothetical protein